MPEFVKHIIIRQQRNIEMQITVYEPGRVSIARGLGLGIRNSQSRISDPTTIAGNVFSQTLAPNAIGGMFQQDHIAINIHLVDLNANVVVASTTVKAAPKDLGIALNLFSGSGGSIADVRAQIKQPCRAQSVRAW
jgi:curli biogenesis system outer membrane secretion channel CsgG